MHKINKLVPVAVLIIASMALAQPTLVSPTNGSWVYDQTPLFDWNDEVGATSYRIQIDDNSDFLSPIVDIDTMIVSELLVPEINALPETLYYWHVRVEAPAPSDWSATWTTRIELKGPDPIAPPADVITNDATPAFIWYLLPGSGLYRLVVTPSGNVTPIIDTTLTDTTFTPSIPLSIGDYNWYTQGRDSLNNWSTPSESWAFTIISTPAGWAMIESVPITIPKKGIKDGGALAAYDDMIYAFQGNGINFWAYDPSASAWSQKCSIGYELKPNGKPNKKKVKGGGSLIVYDNLIYGFKGGNTTEFWAYDPLTNTWTQKTSIPEMAAGAAKKSKVKSGGALTVIDNTIYAFKGGNTQEFWMYDPLTNAWTEKAKLIADKAIKGGGSLVTCDNTIYAFVGNNTINFYAYDYLTDVWTRKADALFGTEKTINKKRMKDGASLVEKDGMIYAFKGGNTQDFGMYNPSTNTWTSLDTINAPVPSKKKVKAGGSLTSYGMYIYAFKGGNSREFWRYTPAVIYKD